jgi:uncharacterized protein (DUF2147 family)
MRLLAAVLLLVLPSCLAQAASPAAVMGEWWTQSRDGVIDIYPCAAGVCGRLVGVTGFGPHGEMPLDWEGRPRCGREIITGGTLREDGVWDSAIVNPVNGRRYTITLQTGADGRLKLRGYIVLPLLGETVEWAPFDGHITRDCHIGD